MIADLKRIHIGEFIFDLWQRSDVTIERTCNYFKCEEEEIRQMFEQETMATDKLLRWSKLLNYDFFRIYSQHLILYAPGTSNRNVIDKNKEKGAKGQVPTFRKNIYTKEIIDYLLDIIRNEEKTPMQIIEEYKIPKTTLYRWIQKYKVKKQ